MSAAAAPGGRASSSSRASAPASTRRCQRVRGLLPPPAHRLRQRHLQRLLPQAKGGSHLPLGLDLGQVVKLRLDALGVSDPPAGLPPELPGPLVARDLFRSGRLVLGVGRVELAPPAGLLDHVGWRGGASGGGRVGTFAVSKGDGKRQTTSGERRRRRGRRRRIALTLFSGAARALVSSALLARDTRERGVYAVRQRRGKRATPRKRE